MTTKDLVHTYAPAPMRNFWQKSCLRKTPYKTEEQARKASDRALTKRFTRTKHYVCSFCGMYHLTSQTD